MSYSDHAENAINDAICKAVPLVVAAIYVQLHIGDPGEQGLDNPAIETTRRLASFGASAAGVSLNNSDIFWENVAAAETYTHVSFWDSATPPNCWGSGPISPPLAVSAGETGRIAVGALSLTTT